MTEEELYKLPFSIARHKSAPYHLKLEVMISPEGEIQYALPSHQEFLIKKAMELHGWTRDELMAACPPEYYFDFIAWLIPQSGGFIPVWEEGVLRYPVTPKQKAALRMLKMAGLFHGVIPPLRPEKLKFQEENRFFRDLRE